MGKLGYYQKAVDRAKNLIKYDLMTDKLFQNIAHFYIQLQQLDSAKAYLQKINIEDIPYTEKVDYYNSLGSVYTISGKYAEALANFDKAQQISLVSFGNKNKWLGIAYAGTGKVYVEQGKFPEALAQYQQAIQSLHFYFNSPDIYQNPADLDNIASPLLLFKTLQQKAHAFRQYFELTHKKADLEAALSTYQLAFRLADRIRKSYDSDEAKLFFTNNVSPVYEEAIDAAYLLFSQTSQKEYLETAFALAEQSKAAVLAESLRALEIRQVPGISQTLLGKEKELKMNISALNIKLVETTDSVKKDIYRDRLRDNEIELAKILKEFENNKQYYQLKYDISSVKVSQMQEMLTPETALVEYFKGQKHMYIFVITSTGFEVKQLAYTPTFEQDLQVFYQELYQANPNSHYKGDAAAYRLYQQLIAPVADLLAHKKRLIIIQDKELSYLPFEALPSNAKTIRYLLHDFAVSYEYSGKILRNISKSHPVSQQLSVLAMAPFSADHPYGQALLRGDVLNPLYASLEEVQQIGGQVYTSDKATKEQFLQEAASYDVIHLATHAKADNQNPLHSFIAFYPKTDSLSSYRLYAQELYNLHLDKLKLIVLSACETSNGKLIQGEGIMSLARAFAYAGCPSIVTTLWKAEDITTADISKRVHQYLKEGKSKDEALQLAKLAYINGQTHAIRRSPVYWANFIFIGDDAPLYADYTYLWWVLSGLAAGVLAVGIWVYYKKTREQKYATRKA